MVNKSLSMPTGKLAAMVAHAAMTFIIDEIRPDIIDRLTGTGQGLAIAWSPEEAQWLTELDPGLEYCDQVSMAKIVCQVANVEELVVVEQKARDAGLEVHRVIDSGCSHNKPGAFACIAIGPDWPEKLEPVTGHLKVYR